METGVDIVSDILRRVALCNAQMQTNDLARIEEEVRRDWGGCSPYIKRTAQRDHRNERICADYDRGSCLASLALRHGLTERRIRQIISSAKPAHNHCYTKAARS